jgi:hypothetical protein
LSQVLLQIVFQGLDLRLILLLVVVLVIVVLSELVI